MRETPRSLGLYFMLNGGLGALSLLGSLGLFTLGTPAAITLGLIYTVYGLISCVNFWIGWNLKKLLVDRPHIPIRFAALAAVVGVLLGIAGRTIGCLLGLAINLYIIAQLKRMAKEADIQQESQILE
jgi:hypothetical protein